MNLSNPKYFEGILQLRNPNEEVINFVKKQVEKKGNVFITKELKVKNGFDYYITSQRYLQSLGKKLKAQFTGELKISPKLHTLNKITSKRIYRVNVLFRMLKFKKWDIIEYRGDEIKIISMAKRVIGKSLKTGKKISLQYRDL